MYVKSSIPVSSFKLFQHLEVHDTIAECMIFANHWVAKKITETYPNQALVRPLKCSIVLKCFDNPATSVVCPLLPLNLNECICIDKANALS